MIASVFFDLDGTLVDTAPDLGHALNLQRQIHGKPALPDAQIRPVASHGSRGLLALGFGITPSDANYAAMRTEYLQLYRQVLTRSPTLFAGMATLLDTLDQRAIKWGIVTNKPSQFTVPLVQAMGLQQRAACVVSGDDAKNPKPSPDTLLMACRLAKVAPASCLYIGDAQRDIEAGKAAGMKTLVALFGYLADTDLPETWGADGLIQSAEAVLDYL